MKALQSELARKVLADRQARSQLRMVTREARATRTPPTQTEVIVLRDGARVRHLTAVVVPKAA